MLRKTAAQESVTDATKFRETVLSDLFDKATPSSAGLAYIRNEVRKMI